MATRIYVKVFFFITKFDSTIFADVIDDLYNMVQERTGLKTPMISDETHSIVKENADVLNSSIIFDRDFNYNYFGFKVLSRFTYSYVFC